MKSLFLFLASAIWCLGLHASSVLLAGGKPVSDFNVVYSHLAEPEEGSALAERVSAILAPLAGKALPVLSDSEYRKGASVQLAHSKDMDTFEYSVCVSKGRIVIDGGGCWAMEKAARMLAGELEKGNLASGFRLTGTVEGEVLFERDGDVNLRILDDNIWDYSLETLPKEWEAAGLDCRDDYRAPRFAQLVRAYMPDVVLLQEYNRHMHDRFYPMIQRYGYAMANEGESDAWNNTPVLYDSKRVELLESIYNLYMPLTWSNQKSKSYTAAVFRQKTTGKLFGVISTHLWWKGEKDQPGSNQARAAQVRLIMAQVEVLKAKYGCPFFVCGDMNSEEDTFAIQQFLKEGYVPCYKTATVYGNRDNGHHECFPAIVGVRDSKRKSPDREKGAIDHCLIYNAQQAEVRVFDCIQAAFTVTMTDHYPNLIDAKL